LFRSKKNLQHKYTSTIADSILPAQETAKSRGKNGIALAIVLKLAKYVKIPQKNKP